MISITYGFVSFYHSGAKYNTLSQICFRDGICNISALVDHLKIGLSSQPDFSNVSYIGVEGASLVNEAVSEISVHHQTQKRVAVFLGGVGSETPKTYLGIKGGRSIATDLALVLAGKRHSWPISFTLTDQLNPKLAEKIIGADARVVEGEIIIIRKNSDFLSQLEEDIIATIRKKVILCRVDSENIHIELFYATFKNGCT